MQKSTLNTLTTFLPLAILPIIVLISVIIPYNSATKIGFMIALSIFPIQGFVFILRKEVFFKMWLSKKQKMIYGIIWLAAGILLIFLCLPGKQKVEITKSITIENDRLLKIVLDDTNEKKKIGDINFYGYIYINQAGVSIGPVKEENGEKIIICDIRGYEYLFYDNRIYFTCRSRRGTLVFM